MELSIMQGYAEAFDILGNAGSEALPEAECFNLDIADIAEAWRRGSVIASWLLPPSALANDPSLDADCGFGEDTGEGRWTEQAAIAEAAPVLSAALFARYLSPRFAEKSLLAIGFGRPKALQP
jgi:6-phosphogluconate dehydrogenase